MTVKEIIARRRSIRRYLDRPVEREKILACLESARLAPSADNVQPWRFVIIDDPELKDRFSKEVFSGIYSFSKFAVKAPVLILILVQTHLLAHGIGKQFQDVYYYLIDAGIAGEHIVLQAEELGLGTCWVGWFNFKKARKILNIPKKYKIVSLLTMGYYEEKTQKQKRRKSLEEIVWFNEID